MKLSVSAYRAHAAAHKKILSSYQLNYGSTSASAPTPCQSSVVPASATTSATSTSHHHHQHHHQQQGNLRILTEGEREGGYGGDSQTDMEEEDEDNSGGPMRGQVDDRGGGGGGHGGHGHNTVTFGEITTVNQSETYRRRGSGPSKASTLSVAPMSPPSLHTSRDEDDEDSSNDCRSPGQRRSLLRQRTTQTSYTDENVTKGRKASDEADEDDESTAKAGKQSWLNVRAAMAYYHSLRKIKRTKSNQRWMKLRTTVQLSSAISTIQKKPPLKREDSFLKRFSTRQSPGAQETVDDTGSEGGLGETPQVPRRRRRVIRHPRSVVNPDENFYFYWLLLQTTCVLYNLWTLIVRQSFPELQQLAEPFWNCCDWISDIAFLLDIVVQLRTGYLEQGLMVYDSKKLAGHYLHSRAFLFDICALCPLDLLQLRLGPQPMLRFPRFLKVYRAVNYYYMVESRTVWPNLWRVLNLIHILLILAHWFGCFYYLLSEAEGFQGDWVYPHRPGDYATLSRKYLGSLYWSTLTLTTIGDLPTPETNAEKSSSPDGPKSLPRRGLKSRLLQFNSNNGYVFTIVSYLIGVFIFATIVGQVGNVITNRNANRLEFERLLDGAKTYMRHHKVPGGMKRRVLRWYDYSWSRGRIQGGGDINTALGLLPDKLKTELALHVNLSVLKKVTIFQECQPEFLHDLVLKMKAYIFTPGDTICRKGEVAREMFIIADGILEVLSETGRVLTTMKAGDFFGEIGILCLDGLNKRTADVRSVGYSELFSLSREDVLAAMKDYPEAQEILQALGRKRLMEVKYSNAQSRKAAAQKASGRWHLKSSVAQAVANDAATGGDNNSTDSDANTPRRIVDKIKCEAKGLRKVLRKSRTSRRSGDSIELQPLHSTSSSKGVLRRMSRVRSDDLSHGDEPGNNNGAPISDPPPVASSPLGAGLPLLSRLRLLKEKQDREENQQAGHSSVISMAPAAPEPEPQPEVIGAGLPLLQRLLLLKAKEAREAKEAASRETSAAGVPHGSPLDSALSTTTPTTPKVIEEVPEPPDTMDSATPDSVTKSNEELLGAGGCSSSSSSNTPPVAKSIRPWSKLKKAAILSDNSYSLSVPATADSTTKISPTLSRVPDIISDNNTSALDKRRDKSLVTDDSDSDCEKPPPTTSRAFGTGASSRTVPTSKPHQSLFARKRKPCMLHIKTKNYISIDDLSPEYCGLPFVKKLKILNERQKLAELESVVKTRSASLDCPETESSILNIPNDTFLTRSHSEACAMLCVPPMFDFGNPPLSPESNETPERRNLKSILKKLSEDQSSPPNPPELHRLMRAPTIEGYAARHSKLSKSVTFNRDTLQSPPQDSRPPVLFPISPTRPISDCSTQTEDYWDSLAKNVNQMKLLRGDYPLHHATRTIFTHSSETTIPGPLDEVVVGGIKQVIQCHLQEMQTKFQNLEFEVRRRDEIICQLQSRIQELERLSSSMTTTASSAAIQTTTVTAQITQQFAPFQMAPVLQERPSFSTPNLLENVQQSSPHVILNLHCSSENEDDDSGSSSSPNSPNSPNQLISHHHRHQHQNQPAPRLPASDQQHRPQHHSPSSEFDV